MNVTIELSDEQLEGLTCQELERHIVYLHNDKRLAVHAEDIDFENALMASFLNVYEYFAGALARNKLEEELKDHES